jgi:pyridoxamine 5'-phosphate oxidase
MSLTGHEQFVRGDLHESQVAADPVEQFRRWFDQALASVPHAEAFTLATATTDGLPSARVVFLRQFDERGFVFYTNYDSRKGHELLENPRAALVFYWEPLERQVRVEGDVEQVTAAESDAYFAGRPRGSCLAAWASQQSRVVPSRETLELRVRELEGQYEGQPVPRPPHWGGYRVRPRLIEFWQGRLNRLHDRLCYRRADDGGWVLERLAP